MRLLLRMLPLFFATLCARAADSSDVAPVTDPVLVRQHYQQVVANPEFHDADDVAQDFRFHEWLSQWLTHLVTQFQDFKYAGQMSSLAWLLVTTLTGFAIAGLIYMLVRLSRRKRESAEDETDAFPEKRPLASPQFYDESLKKAVENRDWHAAWLATWLQFLARLENRRMVDADRSRTNREYLTQLRAQQIPAPALPLLVGLVDDYDRFIYGLRAIDEPVWRAFRQQIDEVSLMLHLRENAASGKIT